MSTRISVVLIAVGVGLWMAPPARAADLSGSSVTLEGFIGWQHLNIPAGSSAAASGLNADNAILGGDLLLKSSVFGIGAVVDKSLQSNGPWDGTVMAGLVFDVLPSLRLEALAEGGRRGLDVSDWFKDSGRWIVGVRPGASFRLMPTPVRFGVTVPIRWQTSGGDVGSPDYGFVGKVGIELP